MKVPRVKAHSIYSARSDSPPSSPLSAGEDDENGDVVPCFKSINYSEEADSVRVVDTYNPSAGVAPPSVTVTPFAVAVLSPKSKAKNQRRLDRYAQSDKVAIAFDIDDEEWTDGKRKTKSDSSDGSRIGGKLFASLSSLSQNDGDGNGEVSDNTSMLPSSKVFLKLLTLVIAVSCGIALLTTFTSTQTNRISDMQDTTQSSGVSSGIFNVEQEPAQNAPAELEVEGVPDATATPPFAVLTISNIDSFVANKAAVAFLHMNKVVAPTAARAGVEVGSLFVHTNDHFSVDLHSASASASQSPRRVHLVQEEAGQAGINSEWESQETGLVVHQAPTAPTYPSHSSAGKIRRRTGLAARAVTATATATARFKREVQGQDTRRELNPTFAIVRLGDTKQSLESEIAIDSESLVPAQDWRRAEVEAIVEDMRMQILQVADWDALERRQQLENLVNEVSSAAAAAAAPQLALYSVHDAQSSPAAFVPDAGSTANQLSLHGATSLFPPPIFAFTTSRLLAPAAAKEAQADAGASTEVQESELESGSGLQIFGRNSFASSGKQLASSPLSQFELVSAEWSTVPAAAAVAYPLPLQGPLQRQWYKGCSIVLSLQTRAPEVTVKSRQQEQEQHTPLDVSLLDVRWTRTLLPPLESPLQGQAHGGTGQTHVAAAWRFNEDGLQV